MAHAVNLYQASLSLHCQQDLNMSARHVRSEGTEQDVCVQDIYTFRH